MAKFKIGDRVRCNEDEDGRGKGCVGTVVSPSSGDAEIEFDAPFIGWGESKRMWSVKVDKLELVTKESKPAYKVGDKVRSLVERLDVTKGATYDVLRVDEDNVLILDDVGDPFCMSPHEIEFVGAAPAAMKFKVGDHVVGKNNIGFPVDGLIDDVDEYDDKTPYRVEGYWCCADDVRLAEKQPAPLTIRAGGYYKTRDGRKVGPMVDNCGYLRFDGWHYSFSGECCMGGVSGSFHKEERDLVAEWPAEKGCAAAQVDVQREEYGAPATNAAFKVGDRVVYDGKTAVIREILNDSIPYLIEFENDVGYGHDGNGIGKVTLHSRRGWWARHVSAAPATDAAPAIVSRIENGQPKPATRPYVHANRDLAAKEAARLADVNNGQEFGVYELVTTRKVERTYEHEWQRLAVKGETHHARLALQESGLTGMQASRVVQEFVAAA